MLIVYDPQSETFPETPRSRMSRVGVAVDHYPCYVNHKRQMQSVDALQITFVVRGTGEHIMGDGVFKESRGSISITYYGEKHTIVTEGKGMEIYNLLLDSESTSLPVLPPDLNETLHLLLPPRQGLKDHPHRAVHLSVPDPAPLAAIVGLMARESRSNQPGMEEVVTDCLRTFLIHCCRAAQDHGIHPSQAAATPAWVSRLTAFINKSYTESLTLEELAKTAGLSPGYLCQAFKRHTGKTVFEYLIERRVQAAMLHLRTTDDKVLGVALDSGFNDLSYFNRTFKRVVGCSPTAWRQKARSSTASRDAGPHSLPSSHS